MPAAHAAATPALAVDPAGIARLAAARLPEAPGIWLVDGFANGLRPAAGDPVACGFLETMAVPACQRLNVERRELLEAIVARGGPLTDEVLLSKAATIHRALRRLGYARDSREGFAILAQAGPLDQATASFLQAMVGFRDVAVHGYQKLELRKVRGIIGQRLADLLIFSQAMVQAAPAS